MPGEDEDIVGKRSKIPDLFYFLVLKTADKNAIIQSTFPLTATTMFLAIHSSGCRQYTVLLGHG